MAELYSKFILGEFSSLMQELSTEFKQKTLIRLLQPPKGGRPLGRLLVVDVQDCRDRLLVTVTFEEYLRT